MRTSYWPYWNEVCGVKTRIFVACNREIWYDRLEKIFRPLGWRQEESDE